MKGQEELWRRSVEGNADAFSQIVSLHQPRISATALSVTLRSDLADDVTQETFLVAWRTRETLRDPNKLSSWLSGIARNLAKKALRGPSREVGLDHSPEPEVASPEDELLEKERMGAVIDALQALSAEEREVLALYYGREESIRRVAEILGTSEAAAQKRISRARRGLRDEVASFFAEEAQRMRSAAAVAALIVAAIGGPNLAKAGPALAGTTARKGVVAGASSAVVLKFVVPCLALVVAAGLVLSMVVGRTEHEEPTIQASAELKSREAGAPVPKRAPSSPAVAPRPRGHRPAPKNYQLTVVDEGMVAVELEGGVSGMYRFGEIEVAPPVRTVSGYVRSPSGVAVEGAVVIADTSLASHGSSLSGKAGAATNASGYFEFVLRSDKAMELLVLHEKGWSRPFPIAAGRDDLSVNLDLMVPGTIRGRVLRGGEPAVAKVSFELKGTTLRLSLVSSEDGSFVLENLPPGTYRTQTGLAQDIAGGSSRIVERELELRSDEVVKLNVELPTGALVAITPQIENLDDYMVEYVLSAGHGDYQAPARAFELHRNVDDKSAQFMLFGGSEKDDVMQFHDVDPGPYTVCVVVWLSREELESFECRHLRVTSASSVVEETFRVPRTKAKGG